MYLLRFFNFKYRLRLKSGSGQLERIRLEDIRH